MYVCGYIFKRLERNSPKCSHSYSWRVADDFSHFVCAFLSCLIFPTVKYYCGKRQKHYFFKKRNQASLEEIVVNLKHCRLEGRARGGMRTPLGQRSVTFWETHRVRGGGRRRQRGKWRKGSFNSEMRRPSVGHMVHWGGKGAWR